MKKAFSITKIMMIMSVMFLMAIYLLPNKASAETVLENGKEITVATGDEFELSTSSKTEVVFTGDATLEVWYGKWTPDSGKLDLSSGVASMEIEGQMVFKVRGGSGKFCATWVTSNDVPERATEITLAPGQSAKVSDEPKYRFYVINVTDPSARFTIKPDNDVVSIDIFQGKIATYASANATYRQKQNETATYVFTKGYWTIVGSAYSKNVEFTLTRDAWVGITKLTPSNNGEMVGEIGTKYTYVVNYEPKNADSKITASYDAYGSPASDIKLVSMANGVATFEVDSTKDKGTAWTYDEDSNSKTYSKVTFTTEEGVSAKAEKVLVPTAAKIEGQLTGSTKSVSIPVSNIGADQFVAYYKDGSNWKKCGSTKGQKGGLTYYVACKGLKPGKTYTFRVYSYACGKKGGYVDTKGATAFNLKPKKVKTKCTKAKFHKKQRSYEWRFNWSQGWYKVYFSDYTELAIKVNFKVPKKAKGTYITVNGQKQKSGKTFKTSRTGRTKAGQTCTVTVQCVRKVGKCIAYGPSVNVKCKLKTAK